MARIEISVVYNRHWNDGMPLQEFLKLGEGLGFDALWCSENTISLLPKTSPLETLAVFALLTTRPRIGTMVLRIPLYNPLLLAKSCVTLDILSGGRLTLGMGVGGENVQEYSASGLQIKDRGHRADEIIAALRAFWTQKEATYQGQFFHFEKVVMEPKPVQAGGPPIWVGGRSEAAMRRAVKLGNGWVPYFLTPERYAKCVESLKDMCESHNRPQGTLQRGLLQYISIGEPRSAKVAAVEHLHKMYHLTEEQVDRFCVCGSAEQCVEKLQAFVEAGVQHFAFASPVPSDQFPGQLEKLATDIAPHLRQMSSR